MRMRALLLTVGALWMSLTFSQNGHAELLRSAAFGGMWSGGAYSNDQTGQFNGCAATVPFKSGIALTVTINRSFGWSVGFSSAGWNLQANQEIPLSVAFDGSNPLAGTAHAINPHMVLVGMAANSVLINTFRASRQMKVYANGQEFVFNLDGTSRLMVEMSRCVTEQLAIEQQTPPQNNQPVASSAAPTAPTELIATRIASNLLLQAKLPNARLLPSIETPAPLRGRGVVWTSDAGAGSVQLISGGSDKDPQHVASTLISSDATTCRGDFASGRASELVDDKVITKAFTGCKESSGTRSFRYFILANENGGFVVYALAGAATVSSPSDHPSPLADTPFQAAAVKAAYIQ